MRKHLPWVLCVTLLAGAAWVVQAGDHEFIGDKKCKMCHKVQHASWLETTHAKATEAAKGSSDLAWEPTCASCHTTNNDEALSGVQCEACHGPGSDYKKMSIMKDREAAIANGLVIPSQETCDACHTGEEHAKKVDFSKEKDNKAAIHEFKAAK